MSNESLYEDILQTLKRHMREPRAEAEAEPEAEAEAEFGNNPLYASRVRSATSEMMSIFHRHGK